MSRKTKPVFGYLYPPSFLSRVFSSSTHLVVSTKPPRRFRVFFRTHLTPSLHRRRRRRRSTGIFLRSHGLDIPRERMEWKETNSRGGSSLAERARARRDYRRRRRHHRVVVVVTTTTAVDRSVESLARLPPGPTTCGADCRKDTRHRKSRHRYGNRNGTVHAGF